MNPLENWFLEDFPDEVVLHQDRQANWLMTEGQSEGKMFFGQKEHALTIVVAPGPDGFGPSVIGSFVIHALWRILTQMGIRCQIIVQTAHGDFNTDLYRDLPGVRIQKCPHSHGIGLAKGNGGVDHLGTRRMLLRYLDEAAECIRSCCCLDSASLVISIGSPHIVFAASWKGIPAVEVFDHSWAETLAAILVEGGIFDAQAAAVVNAIRDFEQQADRVYLFPDYIAPSPVVKHWLDTTHGRVERVEGVLGPRRNNRSEARHRLSIAPSSQVVMFTGGGTGVWNTLLQAVFEELRKKGKLAFNVIMPHPFESQVIAVLTTDGELYKRPRDHYPELLDAASLVISRPGAGIVIDCIDRCLPLLALPEIGHPQVEAIRCQLSRRGLALTPDLKAFKNVPSSSDTAWAKEAAHELLAVLEVTIRERSEDLLAIASRMAAIPVEQEEVIAKDIVRRFHLDACTS